MINQYRISIFRNIPYYYHLQYNVYKQKPLEMLAFLSTASDLASLMPYPLVLIKAVETLMVEVLSCDRTYRAYTLN